MKREDAKLALNIRNLMFTYDDLLSVPEVGIRELVARLDKKVLTLALKGASEEVRDHLMKTISSRAVEMLKEDMEVMGPVRAKEINKAQAGSDSGRPQAGRRRKDHSEAGECG